MSPLKTGLNAPFYQWIDDVRRAFRREKELLEKLQYYNVMFIGYKGINYGQVITNPMPRNDKDMLYWLDKIDQSNRKLHFNQKIITSYNHFVEKLNDEQKIIINKMIGFDNKNDEQKNNTFARKQKIKGSIIRAWFDSVSKNNFQSAK